MNILVIGGTRFIGAYVVRQLAGCGHAVTVYHRGEHEAALPESVRHIHHPEAAMPISFLPGELLQSRPEIVIHMMAMGQADAQSALRFFSGNAGRMVWISSGDVYRAYGRFVGTEPGAVEHGLLDEESPLRTVLYPYRDPKQPADALPNIYDKLLVEEVAVSDPKLPATILRLPKVYGREENANLATVYGFRNHPEWRWTHGYVENVAAAIVAATLNPAASNRIYNAGEPHTPTIGERLVRLPVSSQPATDTPYNFEQNIAYDTSRIRNELGFREAIAEEDAMQMIAEANHQ